MNILIKGILMAGIGAVLLTGAVNGVKAEDSEMIMPAGTSAFMIKDSSSNQLFRVQSDGNVGIANTSPTQKLDVTGTVKATAFVGDGSGLTNLPRGDGHSLNSADNSKTDVVFVDNSGNVGIGTTAPRAKLDVRGGLGKAFETNDGSSITFGINLAPREAQMYMVSGDLSFHNSTPDIGTEIMRIKNSGNVGIGTSKPATKLHIHSDGTPVIAISTKGDTPSLDQSVIELITKSDGTNRLDNSQTLGWQITGRGNSWGNLESNDLMFVYWDGARWNNSMTIDSENNNIGIGTRNPSEKLDVVGNINASGAVTQGSSREFKNNIAYISTQEAIDAVNNLNPVRFNYKRDNTGEEHLGFIAEDVPNIVASHDRKHLNAMDLTAVFAKVIQEQQRAIQEQQRSIQEQQRTIQAMEKEMVVLKSTLNQIIKGRL